MRWAGGSFAPVRRLAANPLTVAAALSVGCVAAGAATVLFGPVGSAWLAFALACGFAISGSV